MNIFLFFAVEIKFCIISNTCEIKLNYFCSFIKKKIAIRIHHQFKNNLFFNFIKYIRIVCKYVLHSFVIIVDLLILEYYTFRILKFLNYLTLDAIISSTRFHICRRDYNALTRLHRYIHTELYTCELLHYHAHYN